MTYNFDPDAWYEREFESLRLRLCSGALTQEQFDGLMKQLDERSEQMQRSLNGTLDYSSKRP